jgi:hypothetical protein
MASCRSKLRPSVATRLRFDGSVLPANYEVTLKVEKGTSTCSSVRSVGARKGRTTTTSPVEVGTTFFNHHDVVLTKVQSGGARSEAPAGLADVTARIWLLLKKTRTHIFRRVQLRRRPLGEPGSGPVQRSRREAVRIGFHHAPAGGDLTPPAVPIPFDFFEIQALP